MQPPLLTRLLLLLIQFTILALALDSKPTLADTAADIVDSMLDDTSPPIDTSPSLENEAQCMPAATEEGGGEMVQGPEVMKTRKRPPMLRRSSSWASSREKVEFVGVLGSGRWLGGA